MVNCRGCNLQQGVTFNVDGAEYGWAELYPDGKYRKDSPLNNAFAINKNAANPERLLMLLELLNTDEEAYDMFMYGGRELAQRGQLYDEQGKLLLAGITNGDDVDTAVQKYIDSQKAAGLDAIMSFMQGEEDKYVAK